MRAATGAAVAALAAVLATAPAVQAKTVESFQVVVTNEAQTERDTVLYLESAAWVQKAWTSFDRTTNTLYFGAETLSDPGKGFLGNRFGLDHLSLIVGYKLRTYLPDWYNFQIRLRVPVVKGLAGPPDEPGPLLTDRLELRIDPLLFQRTWNLWSVSERNRFTFNPQRSEYGNKLRIINLSPDLDFPIATYAGLDLRLRRTHIDGAVYARNDFLLGIASNFTDWLHLAAELKTRLDTRRGENVPLIVEVYAELTFDIFFDNTFGGAGRRQRDVRHDARE